MQRREFIATVGVLSLTAPQIPAAVINPENETQFRLISTNDKLPWPPMRLEHDGHILDVHWFSWMSAANEPLTPADALVSLDRGEQQLMRLPAIDLGDGRFEFDLSELLDGAVIALG